MASLTAKQQRFCEEYLTDRNATQAAIRAGYSERTAKQTGAENLSKPVVRNAIAALTRTVSASTKITAERVLAEIGRMAFFDPADYVDVKNMADIAALPEHVRRAIVGWGWDRNQNFTVKLADKSKALDQLARHLSLYNDKLKVEGLNDLADRLERAKGRF